MYWSTSSVVSKLAGHGLGKRRLLSTTVSLGEEELAYEAKIYASEAAVKTVAEAMHVVGVRAYDAEEWPFARLMADAMVLPVFDGGNQVCSKKADSEHIPS